MSRRTYTLRGLFLAATLALIFLPLVVLTGGLVSMMALSLKTLSAGGAWVDETAQAAERILADRWDEIRTDPDAVRAALKAIGEGETLALEVRDLTGQVLLHSEAVADSELVQRGFRVEPASRTGIIRRGGQVVGIAQLWLWPPGAVRAVNRSLATAVLAGTLAAVAVLLWILRSIGLQIARPLRDLEAATAAIAAGRLDVAVPSSSVRELAALAQSFAAMRDQLRKSLERQRTLEEERRHFIAAVSHDLRTPLSSVRAFAEGLRDGLAREPEKAARYVQVILEKTRELERLVEDLFAYARLDLPSSRARVEPVDGQAYLSGVVQALQPAAAARSVALTAAGPSLYLHLDPDLFARALNNLLTNALRHTPPGGRVSVCWRPGEAGGAVIEVADTGEGIPPEELVHLFSPMHRTDRSRSRRSGGAGLGLAIAARIVRAHGGEITCESKVGEGTRFIIRLPAPEATADALSAPHPHATQKRWNTWQVSGV